MQTKTKSTKRLKREKVIPFHGEENFVVAKKGGFGQADNEHYVMVAGSTTIATQSLPSDSPSSTSVSTSTQIPVTSSGNPITTNTTTQPPTNIPPSEVPCTSYTYGSWSACQNGTQTRAYVGVPSGCVGVAPSSQTQQNCTTSTNDETIQAQQDCTNSGGVWINGACITSTNPRLITTIPTFPIWDSLDCASLKTQIAQLNATLSTSKFAQNVVDAYNTEIAKAQSVYNVKCDVAQPPTNVILPVGGGGIFGGGGGGGIGEPPTDEAPTQEKKNYSWLIIIAILGGAYFLLRKK